MSRNCLTKQSIRGIIISSTEKALVTDGNVINTVEQELLWDEYPNPAPTVWAHLSYVGKVRLFSFNCKEGQK